MRLPHVAALLLAVVLTSSTVTAVAGPARSGSSAPAYEYATGKLSASQIARIASRQPHFSGALWSPRNKTMRIYGVGPKRARLDQAMSKIRRGERVRYLRGFYTDDQMRRAALRLLADRRVRLVSASLKGTGLVASVSPRRKKLLRSLNPGKALGSTIAVRVVPGHFPQPGSTVYRRTR